MSDIKNVQIIFQVGQPLHLACLFVHITVNDYVPNNLNDFANALANPIDYQNAIEMERVREAQLSILGDEGHEVDLYETDETGDLY